MGMPVHHFVASVNSNTTIPRFMKTGDYSPTPTVPTISNAMDVSDPSNFVRVLQLFENSRQLLSTKFSSYSYCDNATRGAMLDIYKEHNYTADPHGAVGYLGLKEYLKDHPDAHGIFLETAHPIKFLPAVEPVVGPLALPEQIKELMNAQKDALAISDYQELKNYLLE